MRFSSRSTLLATTLAFGALAGPAAAMPLHEAGSDLRSPDARFTGSATTTDAQQVSAPKPLPGPPTWPTDPQPLPRPVDTPAAVATDGFDWTDAAIGAGGAIVVIATSLGGAVAIRRHAPRSRASIA